MTGHLSITVKQLTQSLDEVYGHGVNQSGSVTHNINRETVRIHQ